jgi:diguanylate cyclase (GGDEF)-like protein
MLPNEARRLAAIRRLGLVGTPAEERFDRITRLARTTFRVPVALIDLVDDTSVWAKSAQGLDFVHGDRVTSYCQYGAIHDGVCYIPDSLLDSRVSGLPAASRFRFYAGQPVLFDGERVAVLCIVDYVPRALTAEELCALADLAAMVESEFQREAMSATQLELAAENEALAQRALVDPLTRLWNRGAIAEIADRELETARAASAPLAVILLDIDHFKLVNDTYGHPGGDEVLRRVSERIRQSVRPADAVGRWGGEEFLVVLPGCGAADIHAAAERIRNSVAETAIDLDGVAVSVTVSLGATFAAEGEHAVSLLVRTADDGLYAAKTSGRNRACVREVADGAR